MITLKDRCRTILHKITQDQVMRQNNAIETLMAFVTAEIGRNADPSLDQTLPLCLYFGSYKDRERFIELVRQMNPNWVSKRMP